MRVLFFCPRWGHAHLSWTDFAVRAKDEGYDGVETDVPLDPKERDNMLNVLAKHKLMLVAQHWETIDSDFDLHKKNYEERLRHITSASPFFINSQTGRDFFTAGQNEELIKIASGISLSTGIPVFHETHRGKFSFAAHVTTLFLQQLPQLELTFDVSHWIAVAETYLDDQPQNLELAIERTRHIHARVGHTQGPQVTDPRIEQWQQALGVHLALWDKAIEKCKSAGREWVSFTPEFGPAPYMSLDIISGKPVADQWAINVFMMHLLKERYCV